ncbi:Rrf2 family transcriptional regulator [Streptococcus dentiloxodontae]
MQLSSRFTIALHMLTVMEIFKEDKVTSDLMASSIGVNPVVVRRILGQLKAAGIVEVKRGSGGAAIAKPLMEVSFLDVYKAVDAVSQESLFKFHANPNPACSVGKNIHSLLDDRLKNAQEALENQLRSQTLEDLMADAKELTQ